MEDHKTKLANKKIAELSLPGSHDSGSYKGSSSGNFIYEKTVYAQEETILNQLLYGVRYLDIR